MSFTMKQCYSTFNESWDKQIDVVATDSSLGPALAVVCFCFYEKIWVEISYADNILILFQCQD